MVYQLAGSDLLLQMQYTHPWSSQSYSIFLVIQFTHRPRQFQYLGVTIDSDLKFSQHINDIVRRAKQRSALIHRSFISRNILNLLRAFQTYVQPTCRIYYTHLVTSFKI